MPSTISKASRPGPRVYYGEKGWRMVRMWHTLFAVVEAERPLSVLEINARACVVAELREFAGKHNTTRDDLWVLARAGLPLALVDEQGEPVDLDEYMDPENNRRGRLKNTRWCLRSGTEIGRVAGRHCHPTSAELTSLSLLRAMLRDDVSPSYPLYHQVNLLLADFQRWLQAHMSGADRQAMIQRFLSAGREYIKKGTERDILVQVGEGLQHEVMLEGVYTKPNKPSEAVRILPLSAWFLQGKGHLFAARADGGLRNYRLDRFEELRVNRRLPKPKVNHAEVERLLAGRFGGYVGEPTRVRLHASATVSYLFDEYKFHPTQKVRKRTDGSLTVTMECAPSYALQEWILGLGDNVRVLEPADLCAAIAERLRRAAAQYGPPQ